MHLDGLEGLDEEFVVRLADRSAARSIAHLRSCTKKLVKLDGEEVAQVQPTDLVSLLGNPLQSLLMLPFFPTKVTRVGSEPQLFYPVQCDTCRIRTHAAIALQLESTVYVRRVGFGPTRPQPCNTEPILPTT